MGQLLGGGLGGLQCNLARVRIVGALGDTEDAVAQIQDGATQAAATAGLEQAQGGISQIAQAIVAGDAPPASGREQVEAGLTAVGEALASGDAYALLLPDECRYMLTDAVYRTDGAVIDAQEGLDAAVAAGGDVVANC